MASFWHQKTGQRGFQKASENSINFRRSLLRRRVPFWYHFGGQNGAKRDPKCWGAPPSKVVFRAYIRAIFLRFRICLVFFSFGLQCWSDFCDFWSLRVAIRTRLREHCGLLLPFFSIPKKCRELARNFPKTCQEPLPKTSAGERRPVNFHLPSSLHGATATVARRPDPNSPNIKMKGRRCPPLGASDRIE